jgi:hypothetical protein
MCNPPPPTSSFHQLSSSILFDVCTVDNEGTRRPLQSRLRIICSRYHMHGRASVCVCGWVGGGGLLHPFSPPSAPYFAVDSISNSAKTTFRWSPTSSTLQRRSDLCIPKNQTALPLSQFPHSTFISGNVCFEFSV